MDVSLLASSLILVAMGCVALIFSLALFQKSHALGKLPKNLSAKVFDKTFNVFEPNKEHRKIISSHTGLIVFLAVYGSWFAVTVAVFKTFEVGGILGCITLLICAALLMIDETQEIHKNTGIFIKAVKNGTGLGEGDVQALALMRSTLPKLSTYHLILAVAFFASSVSVPFLVNPVFLASAEIASVAMALSNSLKAVPLFALLVIAGLFATALVVIEVGANVTKKRIFGFPHAIPLEVLGRQFFRMKMFVRILHHHPTLHEPQPEETENVNRKDIEEHSNS
jgi:hypothetical protein